MRFGQTRAFFVLYFDLEMRNNHMTEESPGTAGSVNPLLLLFTAD